MGHMKADDAHIYTTCSNCNKTIRCSATDKVQACPECRQEFQLDISVRWVE